MPLKGSRWDDVDSRPELLNEEYDFVFDECIKLFVEAVSKWIDRFIENYQACETEEEKRAEEEQFQLSAWYTFDQQYNIFSHPALRWVTFDQFINFFTYRNLKPLLDHLARTLDFDRERKWEERERRGFNTTFEIKREMEKRDQKKGECNGCDSCDQ